MDGGGGEKRQRVLERSLGPIPPGYTYAAEVVQRIRSRDAVSKKGLLLVEKAVLGGWRGSNLMEYKAKDSPKTCARELHEKSEERNENQACISGKR